MTGHMDDGQQKELERLGVLAWLAKPFTQAQLVEATKTLLAASLPTRA
jgi:CheY-like chemotaxis protein